MCVCRFVLSLRLHVSAARHCSLASHQNTAGQIIISSSSSSIIIIIRVQSDRTRLDRLLVVVVVVSLLLLGTNPTEHGWTDYYY